MSRSGPRPLTIAQQAVGISRQWPGHLTLPRGTLSWTGLLQPSCFSPAYTVSLRYRMRVDPVVRVLDPPLDPGHRMALPHVYAGNELCLFSRGDWDASMTIAESIIPWIAEWLGHYELWKATDRWTGGGYAHALTQYEANLMIACRKTSTRP